MISQVVYKCDDGQIFNDEKEALQHENTFLRNQINGGLKIEINRLKEENRKLAKAEKNKEIKETLSKVTEESGIYMWVNISDGCKKYIGKATNLRNRALLFLNFNAVYAGKKINEAREKFNDPSHWMYVILKKCPIRELEKQEAYFINALSAIDEGYNMKSETQDLIQEQPEYADSKKDDEIPWEVTKAYKSIMCGYHFNSYNSKFRRCDYPIEDFCEQTKLLGMLNKPGKACYSFLIKSTIGLPEQKNKFSNLSILPLSAVRLLAATAGSKECDEDGIPAKHCITKEYEGCYSYNFVFKQETKIPTHSHGFKTKEEAYQSYLTAKVNILREIVEKDKEYTDKETYSIINALTYKDAENIFYPNCNYEKFFSKCEAGNSQVPFV